MSKEENRMILLLHKKKIIYKFVISVVLNVLLLIIPIYYSKIIDSLNNSNFNMGYYFLIIFGLLTIIYRIVEYYNQKAYFLLYLSLYKSYMNLGLTKTIKNSLYSLSRFSLSEYSNIMSEDFEMVSDYYSTLIIRIVEIMEFIYIVVYFFFLNNLIGIITLVATFLVTMVLFYFNKSIVKTNIERKLRNDQRISLFQEIFLSIRAIKGYNIIKNIKNRLNKIIDDYIKWHTKLNMNRFGLREITLGIMDLFKIGSLVIGINLVLSGSITLGSITIIYSYYSKLSELFTSIITLSESLNNRDVSLKRIEKLFQYANDHEIDEGDYRDISGKIIFDNILYGNKITPYLNEVSFTILPNSLTILSGNVNSCQGVFDLLLGYNKPHSGTIMIDDTDFNLYSREDISNNIGFVMEYPTFFNTTIRENLEIFDSSFENIINVCKYLGIDDYIMSLKEGYETILLNNASNIDNDVKYFLSFAEIFLKKSKIILINNVLNHVSQNNYNIILKYLIELKKEHTIIMISNNIKIIKNKNVDKIIFISSSKIIGEGLHKSLIKNNLEYQKLIKRI